MKKTLLLICCIIALLHARLHAQFTASLSGYPLVTTGWNVGGFATVVDSTIQLTTPSTGENGYVYYDSLVNLTACAQFTVEFDFQIKQYLGTTVADGIAFWYISNPPSGFVVGGGIGLPSFPNGLIVVMDTYDNDGDGNNPSASLMYYPGTIAGYTEGVPTGMLAPVAGSQSFIDDGLWHHCKILYNSGNINVYFNYSAVPTLTGFYAIGIAGYFGFSSSTGAAYSTQSVKNVSITAVGIATAPVVTSPLTYCQGDVADTLIAAGTGPFHWYTTDTATVVSLPNGFRPATTLPGTTTYYVRQGSGPCISPPDSVKIIVTPRPAKPVITGTTAYCSGATPVPFTVTGATGTVLWYTTGTGGTGSTTPTAISTATAGITTYWVAQVVAGCESLRDSIKVRVTGTPAAPVITGTTPFCQYAPYAAPTALGGSILWYTTAVGGAGTLTPAIINTAIPGSYTLYATQTDSGCTSARGAYTITVNAKPPIPNIIDSPGHYCPGQPFVPFTIIYGTGVLWYTAATGGIPNPAAPTINTTVSGADTVWATQTVLGCESDRAYLVVTVDNPVTAGFTYERRLGCKADTVVFTNASLGTIQYLWDFGDHGSSVAADTTHVYPYQAMDTVILVARSAYCAARDTQVIDLVHPLHAKFAADTNLVCQGGTITFTDSSYGKAGTALTYRWLFGDGTTAGIASPAHTYTNTGVYDVAEIVGDYVPCYDTAYKTVMIDTISSAAIAATDTVICRGTVITFSGLYSGIGNTGVVWALGNNDSIANSNPLVYGFDTTGVFVISARALYRVCPEAMASRVIKVLPQPVLSLGNDTAICKGGQPLVIGDKHNAGSTGARWKWNTGQTAPLITVTEPGDYTETVGLNGCFATSTITVGNDCYMNVPNVFSPNGDGLNDYFYPRQLLSKGLISFAMQIYNRWGQLVFETRTLDGAGWDGKLNNVVQPEGVYVFVIDGVFKDGQKEHHQGNVTLLK